MQAQKTVQRIILFKAVSLAIASQGYLHWKSMPLMIHSESLNFNPYYLVPWLQDNTNVASLVEHSDRSFAAITRCGSSGSCGPARHASGPSGLAWHTMPCIFLTAVLQNFRWFARYFKTWSHRLEQFCWPDWSFQAIAEGWGQLDDLDMKLKLCQTHWSRNAAYFADLSLTAVSVQAGQELPPKI